MPEKQEGKNFAEGELYNLLSFNELEDMERFDGNAIIKAMQENPHLAARRYQFKNEIYSYYPLHYAIMLGANINVVKAIHNSYPQAIKEKCEDCTVLRLSIRHLAPIEVVKYLILMWPEAVREKDKFGNTFLHTAYSNGAPFEVFTLLSSIWPDIAREKNHFDETPLHSMVLYGNPSMEYVSFLYGLYPNATKQRDVLGRTPLHCAAWYAYMPLYLILFLLEKWPNAILEKDIEGRKPLDLYGLTKNNSENDEIRQVLFHVQRLYSGDHLAYGYLKEMINFFIRIEWWNGVPLLLDKHPTFLKQLEIDFKAFPQVFSFVGRHCMLTTMWELIRNELDIIEGV